MLLDLCEFIVVLNQLSHEVFGRNIVTISSQQDKKQLQDLHVYYLAFNFCNCSAIIILSSIRFETSFLYMNFIIIAFGAYVYNSSYLKELFFWHLLTSFCSSTVYLFINYTNLKAKKLLYISNRKVQILLEESMDIFKYMPDGAIIHKKP